METIIITNNNHKKKILKDLSKEKKLVNYKFFTFHELKKKIFFDYQIDTIAYIVQKYQVNLHIAKIYLENMYFLKELDNSKIKFLIALKKELEENNLLIVDSDFKKYIKNKKIIVYTNNKLSKEEELILKELNTSYEIKELTRNKYLPKVYEAKTEEEEVAFVFTKIAELINKNIPLNTIKIIASNEYTKILNKYAYIYNIPLNIKSNNSYYSTFSAQEFLNNYDKYSIADNIAVLEEKYQDLNELITIINKSVLIKDKDMRLKFIIDDLKQAKIKNIKYDNAILVSTLNDYFEPNDYLFLLGFNINSYPKIFKDDDYLSDSIKELLGLDTSTSKNMLEKENVLRQITTYPNLVITYKLASSKSIFYPSLLLNDLEIPVEPISTEENISYSRLYSELLYAEDLDNLLKFNIISPRLELYQNSLNIAYREYDNTFKGINKDNLKQAIGSELKLSYTNMEMFNECAFKYYISKILKVDIYEETFKTIIGNITHHILELGLTKDIDIKKEIIKYVKDSSYELENREYFYLEKLSEELELVLEIIKSQEKHSKLNKYLFENEMFVYKDSDDLNITFKGLIDKVMYNEINGEEVLAVVDYKTGIKAVNLDELEYGLNIQLPIYLYLLKKNDRFKNASIAGFYIQKVLDNIPNINPKKNLRSIKEDNLKLQGFTNSSTKLLEILDDTYQDSKMIKGLKITKDGNLSGKAKVLSENEMESLIEKVDLKIDELISNIIEGEFKINPKVIKGKNIACKYCQFKDICYKTKKDEVIVAVGGEDSGLDN